MEGSAEVDAVKLGQAAQQELKLKLTRSEVSVAVTQSTHHLASCALRPLVTWLAIHRKERCVFNKRMANVCKHASICICAIEGHKRTSPSAVKEVAELGTPRTSAHNAVLGPCRRAHNSTRLDATARESKQRGPCVRPPRRQHHRASDEARLQPGGEIVVVVFVRPRAIDVAMCSDRT